MPGHCCVKYFETGNHQASFLSPHELTYTHTYTHSDYSTDLLLLKMEENNPKLHIWGFQTGANRSCRTASHNHTFTIPLWPSNWHWNAQAAETDWPHAECTVFAPFCGTKQAMFLCRTARLETHKTKSTHRDVIGKFMLGSQLSKM